MAGLIIMGVVEGCDEVERQVNSTNLAPALESEAVSQSGKVPSAFVCRRWEGVCALVACSTRHYTALVHARTRARKWRNGEERVFSPVRSVHMHGKNTVSFVRWEVKWTNKT